jgi:hypothetical protein
MPYTDFYQREDANGKLLWRKLILTPRSQPKTGCQYSPGHEVEFSETYKIAGGLMYPLEDDTLLYDLLPEVIVRFDKDFKTLYPYDRNRVFIIDYSVIDKARERCGDTEDRAVCIDKAVVEYVNSITRKP